MSTYIKPSAWTEGRKVRILCPNEGLAGKIGVIQRVQKNRVLVHVTLSKKPGDEVVMAYYHPGEELRLV